MGADGIIVNPPPFRQNLCFLERIEQLPIEELVPHLPIERFDRAVLPRRARFDVERLNLEGREPPPQGLCDEFRPVIRPNMLRHAMVEKELGQNQDHLLRPNAAGDHRGQAFSCVLIEHIQDAKRPSIVQSMTINVVPVSVTPDEVYRQIASGRAFIRHDRRWFGLAAWRSGNAGHRPADWLETGRNTLCPLPHAV